jgi:hypothetical protein
VPAVGVRLGPADGVKVRRAETVSPAEVCILVHYSRNALVTDGSHSLIERVNRSLVRRPAGLVGCLVYSGVMFAGQIFLHVKGIISENCFRHVGIGNVFSTFSLVTAFQLS